ncbi:molybdenum cofactor biosynthesis protein [Rhizoctonia solani]|uniref:Molybdenum cofactor biosynthesis protein n=1 Tax=Rhizoctonia solani TaxID=456999 RepID=A0A8H8NZD6_9AGAM|nr:molybdenum cofactor biosynthesis protein [Rhizoctonia solani]QRW22360.1 molybdenum cofactor biosynthesis protein [Rhizoctonia solani]
MLARRAAIQARIAAVDRDLARGPVPTLVDSFGRKHDYLRISLTERCNLRCRYCMPEEGAPLSPSGNILTNDEVVRLARIFVQHGVNKIRITGGEPTLRRGLSELIQELRSLGVKQIGMTSNGIALWKKLPELVHSGLTHLNLSLDTLDPNKFERMTLRRGHDKVLKSLHTALALHESSPNPMPNYSGPQLHSVKLNTVLIRNTNDSEIARFLALTRFNPLSVRFIEFMPFAGNQWDANAVVTASELLQRARDLVRGGWFDDNTPSNLSDSNGIISLPREPTDTARTYRIQGFTGTFGFISSMSDDFCAGCNRLRITADGNLKPCLFDQKETPLRDLLRSQSPTVEKDLVAAIRGAVGGKFAKHGVPNSSFSDPEENHDQSTVRKAGEKIGERLARPMILIGGIGPHLNSENSSEEWETNISQYLSRGSNSTLHVGSTPAPTSNLRHRSFPAYNLLPLPTRFDNSMVPHARWNHTPSSNLTHIDPETGRARMVDVSQKDITQRSATAVGRIIIPEHAYRLIIGETPSGTSHQTSPTVAKNDPATTSQAAQERNEDSSAIKPKGKPGKGDVIATAQIAGIMATKRTSDLIPLCHPLPITHVDVILEPSVTPKSEGPLVYSVTVSATVRTASRTGVEMEALMGANVALLTIWDMLKAVAGQQMTIEGVYVSRKEGGASGLFERSNV